MKKAFNLLTLTAALLISGCSIVPHGGEQSTGSLTPAGTSEGSTYIPDPMADSTTVTSVAPPSEDSRPEPPAAQVITIAEALAKCEAMKDTGGDNKEFFGDEEVIIKGNLYQDITVYTYDDHITLFADETGSIGLQHSPKVWNVNDKYIGTDDSNYYVYGKIGWWYSNPIIKMTDVPKYEKDLVVNPNFSSWSYERYNTIPEYNHYCESIDYNKKGHGIGELVELPGLKCIAKADDNSWLFSDGFYIQNIYHQTSNTAFTVGKVYDIKGISNVYKWKPSLRCLSYSLKDYDININPGTHVVEKTATQLYSLGCPTDDTEKSTSTTNFMRQFKYFYIITNQYIRYFDVDGVYYMVSGDTKVKPTTTNSVSDNRKVRFNNDSMNRIKTTKDFVRIPVRDYIDQDITLTYYCSMYQFNKVNKRMVPQVYLFENSVPRLSFPDIELGNFFSGQSYLLKEGHLYYPDSETAIECEYTIGESTTNSFIVTANGVTAEEFAAVKAEMDAWTSISYRSDLSSETHFVYIHTQANPKFKQGIEYNESKQELVFDFVRL